MIPQQQLTNLEQIEKYFSEVIANPALQHTYENPVPQQQEGKRANFWVVPDGAISADNLPLFGEVAKDYAYAVKQMGNGKYIIYPDKDHKIIGCMNTTDFENLCKVEDMYETAGHQKEGGGFGESHSFC